MLFAFRSLLPSLPVQNTASLPPIQARWRAAGRSVTWVGRVEGKGQRPGKCGADLRTAAAKVSTQREEKCKYKKITVVWHGIPPHLILIPEHQQSWSAQMKSSKAVVEKKKQRKRSQMFGRSTGRSWTFIFSHFPVFRSEKIRAYRELMSLL